MDRPDCDGWALFAESARCYAAFMDKCRLLFSTWVVAALSACAASGARLPTPLPVPSQESSRMELAPPGDPVILARMTVIPVKWPLRFKSHSFAAYCYDTLECQVIYDDFNHGRKKPQRSSASYGPDYQKAWDGSYLGIRNFPPPAQVSWRSKDGSWHETEIDFRALFKDEQVLHNLPREEVDDQPNGESVHDPAILLEVNDRTIRVYMKAFISTKHLQTPGDPYSASRRDLILVKTYHY